MDGGFVKNEEAKQQLFKFLPFYSQFMGDKYVVRFPDSLWPFPAIIHTVCKPLEGLPTTTSSNVLSFSGLEMRAMDQGHLP